MSKKILVVDDNEQDREIMAKFLQKGGYDNIVFAETGYEGLEKAKAENPDLIILDINLPKMDGFGVCRMLKFDENYKNIPIMMCTSRDHESDRDVGTEVGADYYITKDFDPPELLTTIKKALGE